MFCFFQTQVCLIIHFPDCTTFLKKPYFLKMNTVRDVLPWIFAELSPLMFWFSNPSSSYYIILYILEKRRLHYSPKRLIFQKMNAFSSGGSRISGKGAHNFMYRGVGGSLCWFYLIFLNIPWKWNNLVSLRPNYFIFKGYFKVVGGGEQGGWFKQTPWTSSVFPHSLMCQGCTSLNFWE